MGAERHADANLARPLETIWLERRLFPQKRAVHYTEGGGGAEGPEQDCGHREPPVAKQAAHAVPDVPYQSVDRGCAHSVLSGNCREDTNAH
jgi:hypothetical protein